MRSHINILGNNQSFQYLIEYMNNDDNTSHHNMQYYHDGTTIWMIDNDVTHYRNKNNWYASNELKLSSDGIPNEYDNSTIRIYFPLHCVDTYFKGCKYILSANMWINGHKIFIGEKIFKRNDGLCNPFGVIKDGNNEYYEYLDMEIIDPYDITYSDRWMNFRQDICNEPAGINNTGSILYVTLYIIDNATDNDAYIMYDDCVGGSCCFNISNAERDFLSLDICTDLSVPGWKLTTHVNSEYKDLFEYFNETYGLNDISNDDVHYEIVIKNNDTIMLGPVVKFENIIQDISISDINASENEYLGMKEFFSSWNNYSEGWKIVASLVVNDPKYNVDVINIISNEIPITQEVFKFFVNTETRKIIDDMEFINYTVVNKIENNIIQIERPNDSKSNIIQPVFFRAKDTEFLTIHPAVTENISINLDDYKSKVKSFVLQVEGCTFKQIGTNSYGVLFKIVGNNLPKKANSGLYYILDENNELVTSGKYKYVE